MDTILIKPRSKKMFSKVIEFIRATKVPARILSDEEAEDEDLIRRIEESMASGEADKEEMRKFFRKHGVEIH